MMVYTFDKFWKQKVNVCLYIWQALEIIKANVGFSQQSLHYINVVNLSHCNWQLNEFLKYTLMHLRYDTLIYMIFNSLNIEIFNYSWTIVNDYDVLIMMPDDDDEIFHYSEMVTVCSSWTESQGACTTCCPAHSSPDRRGRSSWTSVVRGLSPWHRYSSVTGWWGWGYRRSSETRDKKDCFSWIYVVQMRSGHYVPDTVVV